MRGSFAVDDDPELKKPFGKMTAQTHPKRIPTRMAVATPDRRSCFVLSLRPAIAIAFFDAVSEI